MSFPGMDGLDDLLVNFLGNREREQEPEFQEAKRRVRGVLVENGRSSAWVTQEGVIKRSGLSERATLAALDALRGEGLARRGSTVAGKVVWKWR